MKLIKLSNDHYVIVDDFEIKEGDYYLNLEPDNPFKNKIYKGLKSVLKNAYEGIGYKDKHYFKNNMRKITHSTKPLEQYYGAKDGSIPYVYHKIKPISLSEVEELINKYSDITIMGKLINKKANENNQIDLDAYAKGLLDGFNSHKELTKDKVFTTVETLRIIFNMGYDLAAYGINRDDSDIQYEEYIQSLLPKTEWDVEFDEQNKLKLI